MTIRFFCACGQKLNAPEKKIGAKYDCPICGAPVIVPKGSDPLADRSVGGLTADLSTAAKESAALQREQSRESVQNLVAIAAKSRTNGQRAAGMPAEEPAANEPLADERVADEPAAGKRQPSARPAASAASMAEDLISRRAAQSREERHSAGPQSRPKPKDEEGIDYVALARDLARTLLPGLAATVLLCGGVYWLSSSVMSTRALPELGSVSGVLTLDGKPLAGAIVTFQPIASEEPGSKLSSSVGTTDKEGRYTLMYVRDVRGAVVGEHKVFVQAPLPTGKETIPLRYNAMTELTAK
jgi:hypothetical protein